MLSEKYNGSDLIEYMDTNMYGFWGEGHTWPYKGNPYKDRVVAEETFLKMFDIQLKYWDKVPLVTNTQPDCACVGNSALLDKTIRTHNWIRTDSILIENEQIEALSNRPPWVAAVCEAGMTHGGGHNYRMDADGMPDGDVAMYHVKDVGANYYSLWNHHNINPQYLHDYYERFPDALNYLAERLGFRVRPSWIWSSRKDGHTNLIFGMVNDGISCVPGVLRLTLFNDEGTVNVSGCLDAGFPKTSGVCQAMMTLPAGVDINSTELKLKAELEVKGVRYPIPFAIAQKLNPDGSLTIKRNTKG